MKKYVCDACGWVYDEAVGDPDNGIAAGTKFVSLASIMGMIFYPIILYAFNGAGTASMVAVIMAVLVVYMHRENIKRLREGTESKLSFKKKSAEDTPADQA